MFETRNCEHRRQLSSIPATIAGSPTAYLARSNFPLRNYLKIKSNFSNYTDPVNSVRMKRLSLKSKKANGIQKLDSSKKKSIDYSEMAYREAVSKLKYLLAESYVSKPVLGKSQSIKDYQSSNIKINESKEDANDKSLVVNHCTINDLPEDMNRVLNTQFTSCKNMRSTKTYNNLASLSTDSQSVPPELNSFIEQQEEYIQQLQQESQFCRNQLNKLLHKVREVVAENEALHYKNKTGFFKCVLDEYSHVDENDNESDKEKSVQIETCDIKKSKTMEGPNIVFESRISELEAQLTQAKLELRKVQEENQRNLKQMSTSCLNNDTSEMKIQLEKALRAKYEAEMKVQDLQKTLTSIREQETEALQKIKQTGDAMQQIQFEKSQSDMEIKRLKDELDRQHGKLREATQEATNLQSDLNQALTEKDAAEQEVLAIKLAAERNERQNRQEQSRLQIEINSYKQRLERTETDLVHLRRENLRLSEQIASLEKEINANKPLGSEDLNVQDPTKSENGKELASMIIDMETKHAATVAGLEDALNNQATIVSRLTAECQSLTQRLEANSLKHKEEMASLQNNIEYLSDKIQNTFNNQQGTISMESRDISPNTLMQAQNTSIATAPHIIYQEHDMKINEMNNQPLESDLSDKIEYTVDYEAKNDITNTQMYEQNQNENDGHENTIDHQALESYVPEQEYNSYDQYNVMESEQQERSDAIQNSNEVTLSQYSALDT
nr:serologically defined colon cancer antigen 8 homolog isoform X2 [Megalopta genalis]